MAQALKNLAPTVTMCDEVPTECDTVLRLQKSACLGRWWALCVFMLVRKWQGGGWVAGLPVSANCEGFARIPETG